MRSWRKWLLWSSLIAGLFFLAGFVKQYHLPRIEHWLLQEIEKQSSAHSPIRVWPTSAQIAFFPPSLVLNEVRLLPKDEFKAMLAPTSIKQAEIRLNWFYLMIGRLRLSYIGVRGLDLKVFIKEQPKSKNQVSALNFDFNRAAEIPIDELEVEDLALWARLDEFKSAIHMNSVRLQIKNRSRNFMIDLNAPEAQVKWQDSKDPIPLELSTRFLVDPKGMRISSVKAKAGDSFVVAAGHINKELDLQSRIQVSLKDVGNWEKILMKKPTLPKMKGEIRSDLLVMGPTRSPRISGKLTGTELKVENIFIGNVTGEADWHDQILKIPHLRVQSPAGMAEVKSLKWHKGANPELEGAVLAKDLELHQLLNQLSLEGVPVHLKMNAELKCAGSILENTKVRCEGAVQGRDLLVHTGKPSQSTIVQLQSARAKGFVTVSKQNVIYEAALNVGEKSTGKSIGLIDYKKGFQIQYEGDNVQFADVKNLGNLRLEGGGRLKGTTSGNSKSATLTMDIKGKDIWLENYWLGNPETEIAYRKGTLFFNKLLGQAGTSRYQGQLSINFDKHELFLQARSPYADLTDLKDVFRRFFEMPMSITGTGAVEVKAWGPLKFNQLSYGLSSSFYRGTVAGETFDLLQFNMSADRGNAKTDRVAMTRGQSAIEVNGKITPQGMVDAVLVGRRLRLEESENISRLGMDLTGQVDLTMAIRGQLPRPGFEAHGRLSHLVIGDKVSEDSIFKLKLSNDRLEGGGSFIGNVVTADFVLPLTNSAPFSLKAKTKQWNFAQFFSIFSNAARQRDIQTFLTTDIQLASERGGFGNASGEVTIGELGLKRGTTDLKNNEPIRMQLKTGTLSAAPFTLEGSGGYVKGSVNELNAKNVKASLNGKLDLGLLTLFTPFLADLQGRLTLNIGFSGKTQSPQMAGSAYIDQGLVRLKGFPHPFTNLRSDMIFSESGVNINALRADLGGGQVTGEGRVRWLGPNQFPVEVRGQAREISLNVPENFRTRGSGSWSMRGNYFPYVLAVDYDVTGGEITAEFQDTGGGGKTVAPSALLPKFLVQSTDQPVHLDLRVNLKTALPIRNSLVVAPIRGRVQVLGPPTQPRLTGVLTPSAGGKVFFRDVPFEIQNGLVEYQDDPPDNPKVYLTARAEVTENVRDDSNPNRNKQNDYEVNLLVQGKIKPKPKFTLTSLPVLSEKEIVSLLALGATTSALDQSRSGQIAASNSVQYGAAILQKPLGKEVRNRLGFDMQVSQTSAAEDATSSTQVTFIKQFTPKFSASASRTIEKNPTSAAKMEYKFKRGFSVIGSWQGKEGVADADKATDNTKESVLGLDLEYKVNFK